MKTIRLGLFLVIAAFAAWTARADLTHRYSFTNDANDSVGTAHGVLNGGVFVDSGTAVFDGVSGSFIELPPGIISNYTSVTLDFWTDVGVNGNWPELYAFGNRDASGNGAQMIMFTPHSGNNDYRMSFADADPGYNHEFVVTQPGVLDGLGPIHITCVYDIPNHSMALYTNGLLAASRSADLGSFFSLTNVANVHSWLGQSLYAPDAPFTGSIDEFRIYNTPLNAVEVAANQVGGPDTVGGNLGALTALRVTAKNPLVKGLTAQASVAADFDQIQGVTLFGVPGVTYTSSNTNIFTVTPAGNITAAGAGSATLTATYQGKTATQTVNVNSDLPTAITHRYSFTDDANDSVGSADGILQGAFVQDGEVMFDGSGSYVELPPDLFTNYDSITFETWVTDAGSATWARIWDFGNSSGGPGEQGGGLQYMFLSLPAGPGNLRGAYTVTGGGAGEQVVEWPGGRPAVGEKTHIAWTSDAAFHTGKLYVNGVLVGINTNMTLTPRDIGTTFNDWLGRSQYNDPPFNGSMDEFRVYQGALTPLQVALDAATGPNTIVTNAGSLVSLSLSLGTNSVVLGGFPVQAQLIANYQNVSNVSVTTLEGVSFSSGNTNIAGISSNGLVSGASLSNTVLTATFGGKTATLPVTVTTQPGYTPATLVHRYSFSDAPGSTTVKDSVGDADGTLAGTGGVFDGTQLTLPGGTSSSADPGTIAGYVDLPNHIISPLTNISIEAWVTWQGSGSWQRIFDFGTSATGEDVSDGNGSYLFLSPSGPSTLHFSVRDPNTGAEPAPLDGPTVLATNQQVFLAVVYDFTANVATMYSNSVVVARRTAPVDITTIDDVNNWLGRSQWPDPLFAGKYNEFRIWDGALLPTEIANHYAAGPDSLVNTPAASLSVTRSGNNIVISWAASNTGFTLQSSPALGTGAAWTPVQTAPSTANGITSVTVPIGTGTQFFRLTK